MKGLKTYENIWKNAIGKKDDYTSGCTHDYTYFKENYKLIAIDLHKKHYSRSENLHYWRSERDCFKFFKKNGKLLYKCVP